MSSFVEYCVFVFFLMYLFFFSSRRRHTRFTSDWSSDVCSSDLRYKIRLLSGGRGQRGAILGRADSEGIAAERCLTASFSGSEP